MPLLMPLLPRSTTVGAPTMDAAARSEQVEGLLVVALAAVLALLAAYAALMLAGRRRAACSAMCCGTLLLELLRLGSARRLSAPPTGPEPTPGSVLWRVWY